MRHRRKDSAGAFSDARACVFRRVICLPQGLTFEMLDASDSSPATTAAPPMSRSAACANSWGGSLRVNLTLPPGAYATMCMRELTKTSLHPARHYNQRKLFTLERNASHWQVRALLALLVQKYKY